MSNRNTTFEAKEFCSRKLWQLVSSQTLKREADLRAAVAELAQRRHYLTELKAHNILH